MTDKNSNEIDNNQDELASIDVYTEFGMLSPSQILFLFNYFKNSSHYEKSNFRKLQIQKLNKQKRVRQ